MSSLFADRTILSMLTGSGMDLHGLLGNARGDPGGTAACGGRHPLGGLAVVEVDGRRLLLGGVVPLDGISGCDDLAERPFYMGPDVHPLDRAAPTTPPKIILLGHIGTEEQARLVGATVAELPLPSSRFSGLFADRRILNVRNRLDERGGRYCEIELTLSFVEVAEG